MLAGRLSLERTLLGAEVDHPIAHGDMRAVGAEFEVGRFAWHRKRHVRSPISRVQERRYGWKFFCASDAWPRAYIPYSRVSRQAADTCSPHQTGDRFCRSLVSGNAPDA